jgi:hypothetical protein
MLVMADTNLVARIEKPSDWNSYEIVARGPEIQLTLNGQRTASYVERAPGIDEDGLDRAPDSRQLQSRNFLSQHHHRRVAVADRAD